MKQVRAFILGVIEFKNSYCTNCDEYDYNYELGREFAHKVTLRKFEQ
jgi:hypothetical protein